MIAKRNQWLPKSFKRKHQKRIKKRNKNDEELLESIGRPEDGDTFQEMLSNSTMKLGAPGAPDISWDWIGLGVVFEEVKKDFVKKEREKNE